MAAKTERFEESGVTVIPLDFESTFIWLLNAPSGALAASHARLVAYEPFEEWRLGRQASPRRSSSQG